MLFENDSCWSLSVELSLVLSGVEMTFRFRDQSLTVDLPRFAAADPDFVTGSAWTGVRSGKCPMKFDTVRCVYQPVEHHDHVRKIAHKSARNFGDRSRRTA